MADKELKTVKIDEDLHRWAKTEAARTGRDLQEILDEIIREAKRQQEEKRDKGKGGPYPTDNNARPEPGDGRRGSRP